MPISPHSFPGESTNAPEAERDYGVFLSRGEGERRYEVVRMTSRDRAADAAEKLCNLADGPPAEDPPWQAIAVIVSDRFDIAGRCIRCQTVLFCDNPHQQTAQGVVCGDGCRQW